MPKRYMVFVSSTYEDLKDERLKVAHSLLKAGYIPAGMEFIPADDKSQWQVIQRVIDESDYYLVIVGQRYGSLAEGDISWTRREYEYAAKRRIPIASFLLKVSENASDATGQPAEHSPKLAEFTDLLKERHYCSFWDNPDKLSTEIITSLSKLVIDKPALGWVRDTPVLEYLSCHDTEDQEAALELITANAENLDKSTDITYECSMEFMVSRPYVGGRLSYNAISGRVTATMKTIFMALGPEMLSPAQNSTLEARLCSFVHKYGKAGLRGAHPKARDFVGFRVDRDDFNRILIRFRTMGFIEEVHTLADVPISEVKWQLTKAGNRLISSLHDEL
ncbi:MAG: DUF4062 domain-containing protein [candidate division Zixibacteria bacterium]|nr:DUF4062 domain-containing protein [candidate division Zixibacteria bacterium]